MTREDVGYTVSAYARTSDPMVIPWEMVTQTTIVCLSSAGGAESVDMASPLRKIITALPWSDEIPPSTFGELNGFLLRYGETVRQLVRERYDAQYAVERLSRELDEARMDALRAKEEKEAAEYVDPLGRKIGDHVYKRDRTHERFVVKGVRRRRDGIAEYQVRSVFYGDEDGSDDFWGPTEIFET